MRNLADPLSTITANDTTKGIVIEAAGNTYDAADPRHPQHGDPDAYYRAWPTSEPLRTLHGTASKALLIPVEGRDGKTAASVDDPLRTQTCRNETGLLVPSGGTWHEDAHPTTDPMRTVTASGNHHGLMSITEDDVMACRFRMLEPSEIAAGMAFRRDYRWQGTKRERVRLAGNAVTPPAARDLITVVAASLGAAA